MKYSFQHFAIANSKPSPGLAGLDMVYQTTDIRYVLIPSPSDLPQWRIYHDGPCGLPLHPPDIRVPVSTMQHGLTCDPTQIPRRSSCRELRYIYTGHWEAIFILPQAPVVLNPDKL